MAEGKKSFVLYTDYMHTVCKLSDVKAGKLFKHILKYVNDENPVTSDKIIELVFEPIRQQLKRDLKDWEAEKHQRSEAGKKGGKKSAEIRKLSIKTKHIQAKSSTASKIEANQADTVNVIVTVNDNVFINIGPEKFLMKPSELAQTDEFLQRTEVTLQTSLSGINAALLWERFDKDYSCHDFTDRNHFYNALKKIGEEILSPPVKGYAVNHTSPKSIPELTRPK